MAYEIYRQIPVTTQIFDYGLWIARKATDGIIEVRYIDKLSLALVRTLTAGIPSNHEINLDSED
jgi:hypothetical protein